ncbi:MAG TPA: aspartate--tRNA ligase [Candidatus Mediterraneibacter pullicola]|uniref:Aspartate--tRNA(Asp/Asn) ligase n=1 Tax=Candidatus Mediterraneibacter pullicola TaxID=2838682 RepID=A0A9D2KJE4_9FIRM|nr:aspartate--tRNA ligase [Candidatus Mediterraneibacter pullicola]
MAESMQGLKRTHRCGELSAANTGEAVTIMGWVQKNRNKGGLVFVDVRDRSGIVQIVCDEANTDPALLEKAASLRAEYVVAVVGEVAKRSGAVNDKLSTGEIEILPSELRILSEAQTPPFPIEENSKTKEEVRLKYRYLDLRRPDLQRNLMLKSQVMTLTRQFFAEEGFLEVETPILGKSTPEGARDYLVPSRIHPGNFYGLPQSPQLYKQLLMCSGFDRYIQIARCFRDEDLRADRQPEFTQIDMELSFVDVDDVIDVNERYLAKLFKEVLDVDVQLPIQRITWQEAMDRFGSDKPDLRFGMELQDVTDVVKGCGFGVFTGAIENGGSVRGINAKGQGAMPRKKIDKLTVFVKDYGAKGLAYIALQEDGTVKSSFAKFMTEEEMSALIETMGGEPGDLLLFAADKNKIVWDSLGALRVELAKDLDLLNKNQFRFVWITEFPQFEWSEEQGRFVAMHHPFTMPMEEDLPLLDSDPGKVRAKAYDIVLNGNEIGGGSVRIFQDDVQEKMFEALGFTKEQAHSQFGFLIDAFKYGVPPHAGLAYGLDRLVMLMAKQDSIRDVIAFPKVKDASCLMTEAPGAVDDKQLAELGLEIRAEE